MSLFKGTKTTTRSQKIESFMATACEFGAAVPLLYGTCKTAPNLINYQDFTSTEHAVTTKSGKSKSTSISYYYNAYLELALGEGPITDIGTIWVGDNKYGGLSGLNANGSLCVGAPLSANLGNNSSPTSYMQSKHSSIACGYSNLAYLYGYVFLGEDSASVPNYSVEVKGQLLSTGDGIDASPAYIIKDILEKLGLGNYIDATTFQNYVRYCREADLLVSTPSGQFNSQAKAQDVIAALLDLTNTYMYWNTDRFCFVPRDDRQQGDWTPNKTVVYDLSAEDLALENGGIVSFKRKDSSEIYNYITVKFTNRANDYEEESVSYQDVDNIREKGIKSITLEAQWLHTKSRAIKYAKSYARKCLTEINQYTLKLDWAFCRLTPGDLIRVNDTSLGITNQVMMVSEIQEDANGLITVIAIQRAAGNYSEAVYNVSDDYNYQDFNIAPSNTAAPLFIIPPADLITSSNGLEVWIGLHGTDASWGGCDVYASDQDGNYRELGRQGVSSIYGKITAAMSASSASVDVKFSNPRTVSINPGSVYDAEQGNTLIWVNGECMSYTGATLIGQNSYRLTGLIRGQYGTKAAVHSANDAVAVLDGGIYVVPLTKHYLGRNLYFKFPSFNVFEANGQSLTDLDYYNCVANIADMPNCRNITAYNKYREMADDVTRYDVVVEWDLPDNFASYQQAQVWYKTSGTQGSGMGVVPENVVGAELGLAGRWIYGGQGYNTVTIPQAIIGDMYKIAICCQDIYGNVETPDMSPQVNLLVALKTEIPNTPANLAISLSKTFNISWSEVRNADIKYYEVRLDANVGVESANLIVRTTERSISTNAIESRTGTIYVFAVSAYDKSSAPAKMTYNYPAPSAPTITCESKLAGIECVSSAIPANCHSVHWFFDGTDTDTDVVDSGVRCFFQANAGVYEIYACFQDYFGDGVASGEQMVSVLAYIDESLIKSESITLEKLSADAQKAIEEGGVDTVNIAVKGMLGEGSALVLQPSGDLALVASNGEILTGLFANQDGVIRLQGKYIHLTGDTVVDGSIITNNMLAGGITADKINVSSLSAIKGTIGLLRTATSGARMELESNQLRVYDGNNALRVRLGIW